MEREKSAGYLTNWAARLFAKGMDRRLKEAGLSSGQLPLFFALGDGRALSQKALVEIVSIEQSTMAATLSRMERDGLIERTANPDDGRSALFKLTPAALKKMENRRRCRRHRECRSVEGPVEGRSEGIPHDAADGDSVAGKIE